MEYNIYCDESCHLEFDDSDVMVLGAVTCPKNIKNRISKDIQEIKKKHNLSREFEIKWAKIGDKKVNFYLDLIDYFFMEKNLRFRGVIALNKQSLDNNTYNNGDYNLWYYKMYFYLLNYCLTPNELYNVYIDIKDTNGGKRIAKLNEVLCNNIYDFKMEVLKKVQLIRSEESDILQLTDLIIGALSYCNRFEDKWDTNIDNSKYNKGKIKIVQLIKERTGLSLRSTTPLQENKDFNLFVWVPRK